MAHQIGAEPATLAARLRDVTAAPRALSAEAATRDGPREASGSEDAGPGPHFSFAEPPEPLWDPLRRALRRTALALVIIAAVVHLFDRQSRVATVPAPANYVTAPAVIGDLTVKVTATGTLEPVRIVEVSTELSGTIKAVHVDNNDKVAAGQLLAELDTSTIADETKRAKAASDVVRARLEEARHEAVLAESDLERKSRLAASGTASERDVLVARTEARRVAARIAALAAELEVAEADYRLAAARLAKARIVAPIDGFVLRRNIEPGQTVAASLAAPVLFRIAPPLDEMQVRVDVDEADALEVAEGQPATFEVHAVEGQALPASVRKLYVGPEIVEGVVTYKAILAFDNTDGMLKPGMTAHAEIEVGGVSAALLVPNAALRFAPPDASDRVEGGLLSGIGGLADLLTFTGRAGSPAAGAAATQDTTPLEARQRRLTVVRADGSVEVIIVDIGVSDGLMTEIVGGPVAAGDQLAVDWRDGGS